MIVVVAGEVAMKWRKCSSANIIFRLLQISHFPIFSKMPHTLYKTNSKHKSIHACFHLFHICTDVLFLMHACVSWTHTHSLLQLSMLHKLIKCNGMNKETGRKETYTAYTTWLPIFSAWCWWHGDAPDVHWRCESACHDDAFAFEALFSNSRSV